MTRQAPERLAQLGFGAKKTLALADHREQPEPGPLAVFALANTLPNAAELPTRCASSSPYSPLSILSLARIRCATGKDSGSEPL